MKFTRKQSITKGIEGMQPFEEPYDCENYLATTLYVRDGDNTLFDETYTTETEVIEGVTYHAIIDTFYIENNPNHHNIDVEFWVKCTCDGGGTACCPELDDAGYYKFEFPRGAWPVCGENLNGRFPLITRENETPMEGTIAYAMKSSGFQEYFGNSTFKLKVRIRDRALNVSNEAVTRGFTLAEITRR
jgi:hypothetical protein